MVERRTAAWIHLAWVAIALPSVAVALEPFLPSTPVLPAHAALAQDRPGGDSLAVLEGAVLAEGSERRLPGAVVELLSQERRTVADSHGRFRLAKLLPGPDTLRIALLGFESERLPVVIAPGGRHRIELTVAYPYTTLEEIVVEVSNRRVERMRGFEQRRRQGIGTFVTGEEIDRRGLPFLSSLLWTLPRVRVRNGRVLLETRGVSSLRRGSPTCAPVIFVDGVKRGPLTRADDIRPEEVGGIEVYHAPFVPGRFSDFFNRCGSVVIWRRLGRSPG